MKPFEKRIIETLRKCEDISDASEYYKNLQHISRLLNKDASINYLFLNFTILGNKDRLLILESLAQKDRCSCEFEALLNKSQPAVSRDLKKLEELKLIKGWKKGNFIHYSIIKSTFNELLNTINLWINHFENIFGTKI